MLLVSLEQLRFEDKTARYWRPLLDFLSLHDHFSWLPRDLEPVELARTPESTTQERPSCLVVPEGRALPAAVEMQAANGLQRSPSWFAGCALVEVEALRQAYLLERHLSGVQHRTTLHQSVALLPSLGKLKVQARRLTQSVVHLLLSPCIFLVQSAFDMVLRVRIFRVESPYGEEQLVVAASNVFVGEVPGFCLGSELNVSHLISFVDGCGTHASDASSALDSFFIATRSLCLEVDMAVALLLHDDGVTELPGHLGVPGDQRSLSTARVNVDVARLTPLVCLDDNVVSVTLEGSKLRYCVLLILSVAHFDQRLA